MKNRRIEYLEKLCAQGGYTAGVQISYWSQEGTRYGYVTYPRLKELMPELQVFYDWLEFQCHEEEFMRSLMLKTQEFYGSYIPSEEEFKKFMTDLHEELSKTLDELEDK